MNTLLTATAKPAVDQCAQWTGVLHVSFHPPSIVLSFKVPQITGRGIHAAESPESIFNDGIFLFSKDGTCFNL